MKRLTALFLSLAILLSGCGAGKTESAVPEISQMEAICELAVMDCYYHNVAKFTAEDAEKFLWWSKDAHFWIEYSGIVTVGLDMSQVKFDVDGTTITITLPEATVQGCKVDSNSLTEDSYIVDKDSAKITAEYEVQAFALAQEELENIASADATLLAQARKKAQALLKEYIDNLGQATGTEYQIEWVLLESTPAPAQSAE